ncbi:putative leucine-rich repeats and immunoglobulin-like domain [Sesbania bispinosa]|nr:putative leucine-rich repeats and immunoglobulin-like domain [Sesbania bispinosa]
MAKDKVEKSGHGLDKEESGASPSLVGGGKNQVGDSGDNLVKESFENAMAQIRLKIPGLNLDGMSHEFEVLHSHICRVDTEARKLYDVDTRDEVVDWDEDGEYRKGN